MDKKTEEAYKKLKDMALFCEDYKAFRELFYSLLNNAKKDIAIEYLLRVVFKMLKSDGEIFNEVLALSDKNGDLKTWLRETRSKLKG
ncbi:MAG: hypothetical protein PHI02_06310 [Sulfurovaceae bacterium]|nr:hypothetical protein [Sulfurovaceae bacterium]